MWAAEEVGSTKGNEGLPPEAGGHREAGFPDEPYGREGPRLLAFGVLEIGY